MFFKIMNLLRRYRLFRIVALVLIIIPLSYLLFQLPDQNPHNYLKTSRAAFYKGNRTKPKLVKRLSKLEPRIVPLRKGPGENGTPHFLKDTQLSDAIESELEYGMNVVSSDEISLDRSIPDTRLEQCRHWEYPNGLPSTSVIIVFYNEGLSVVLRTIHSVLNRSPTSILKEVLLVDDCSTKQNLKSDLDNYISKFNGKVRLVRNTQREGLIRSRSRGVTEAIGNVIVFLDAHCEVNINWLPPLLAPIYRDKTILTVPIIDGIDCKTFEYQSVYTNNRHYRGIFEWGLLYKETELSKREDSLRRHVSEPYKSPTHAGGLFAIDREYFLSLGGYDNGLLVWGGENFELSFKVWQCGGSIEWVPCSRVGHVYRGHSSRNIDKLSNKTKGPTDIINYKRVIETWFDDKYKEYFYTRQPLARFMDMGDITAQLELKQKLKCKSFEWYMKNVAYDVLDKYPELPPNLYWGHLRSLATNQCLDTLEQAPPSLIAMRHCHGFGSKQLFRLNAQGQLGVGERCVKADSQGIKLVVCKQGTVDGPWHYDSVAHMLYHTANNKCMTLHPQIDRLFVMPCDDNNKYQQWVFQEIIPKW